LQQGGTAEAMHLNDQLLTLGTAYLLIYQNNQNTD